MNENMSTGTIVAGGIGIVGLIGAAIYIYKRVKEARKPIEITLDEGASVAEETTEPSEETEKAEKKAAITEKISTVSKNIGKTIGTAFLKFGAKHPKITKAIFKVAHYLPYAAASMLILASLIYHKRTQDFMDGIVEGSVVETEDGIEFTRVIPAETTAAEEKPLKPWHTNWDEKYRDNYNKVHEFANTLTLDEGETYIIEDQKQYNLDISEPCVSHLVYGSGAYPPEED